MLTTAEQLAICDELEARVLNNLAHARAYINRRYEPAFSMLPQQAIWSMPNPHDDYHPEWDRVFYASVGAATALTFFAAFVTLVQK